MSFYHTDIITHIPMTSGTFEKTRGTEVDNKVRVENNNRLIQSSTGESIKPNFLIMASPKATFKKGDLVKLKKVKGVVQTDARELEIIEVFNAGGFISSHLEIFA